MLLKCEIIFYLASIIKDQKSSLLSLPPAPVNCYFQLLLNCVIFLVIYLVIILTVISFCS